MNLLLQRIHENNECVIGALSIDGATECFTLELPTEFNGIEDAPDKTCIPAGTYRVEMMPSLKVNRIVPHVLSVPGREAIEIHIGNTAADIRGCIIVGEVRLSDTMIGDSKLAFDRLEAKMEAAWLEEEEILLTVKNQIRGEIS